MAFNAHAQQKISLDLIAVDSFTLAKKYQLKNTYANQSALEKDLILLLGRLRMEGYVTTSIDSLLCDSLGCKAYLFLGATYQLDKISNGNVPDEAWKKLGIDKLNGKMSLNQLPKIEKKVLVYYENHGYPYAEVSIDSIALIENSFSASIMVEEHELILIDTVIIHGNTKTKSKFLARYLGIQPGDEYNQAKLNSISSKLKQLSYLQESKISEVFFTPGNASLHVFLEKQKSNQFNLVLGILPNDKLTNKKVTITGDGKLKLMNQFGVGEEILAEFRQLKPRTQNLDIVYAYPYILNSAIGTFGSFNLYKNDSLFLDINTEIGAFYQFGGFNRLKFYYKNQTSNILNADTIAIKSSGELPNILDLRNNSYGLTLELQKLDYVLNPRKGYIMSISGGVGLNKIKTNQSIATLKDFKGDLLQFKYDSLKLKKVNYTLGFSISRFYPIKKRSTILLQNVTKVYIAKNILNNEKFRIGGYKFLRGFDEEAIYTPFYSIFTTEFRFLLSKNSFFNLFTDVAIVENENKGAGSIDIPFGFGAGLALETKGGIFSISYALGKNLDNKIQVRNGKIHFGFISLF